MLQLEKGGVPRPERETPTEALSPQPQTGHEKVKPPLYWEPCNSRKKWTNVVPYDAYSGQFAKICVFIGVGQNPFREIGYSTSAPRKKNYLEPFLTFLGKKAQTT